jgi:hypothetical protein
MGRAIPLLTLWAFVACYRENFTFTAYTLYNNTLLRRSPFAIQLKSLSIYCPHNANFRTRQDNRVRNIGAAVLLQRNLKSLHTSALFIYD